jgi:histone arginine demethylase JMJD6
MEIQKVGDISHKEFMEEFFKPGKPVVFKNASKVWKANGLFTPDWFRENYGDRKKVIDGTTYTMRQIMDLVENSTEANPAPYPIKFTITETLPELLPLIKPLNLGYVYPNWLENKMFRLGDWGDEIELFIGGAGGKFPYIHLDYYHLSAWITQLYGDKRFTVFPPGQEEFLYPNQDEPWRSDLNIFEPDYEKYPKYRQATPISFTVGAGETLYIPFGTWHSAYSLTPTISVAFDQLNQKNYKDFMKDLWDDKKRYNKLKAAAAYSYAWVAGQTSKIADKLKPKNLT